MWGRGLRFGVCSAAASALAPLDRRLRSGLILRGPGQDANPAPGTPEHRRRLCFFSGVNAGLDHLGSGRSGQVAQVPDSEDRRSWRPSWLKMRPLPPRIVGWPGPHDWGTIGGGRTGRGISSGGACRGDGTNFPVNPPVFLEPRREVARLVPDGSPGHAIKGDAWESQVRSSAGSRGHRGGGRSCGTHYGPNRRWERIGFPLALGLVVGTYLDIAWFPLGPSLDLIPAVQPLGLRIGSP